MRKCRTCDGNGELTTMEAVSSSEPWLTAPVGVETCPDCGGTGEVEDDYEEEYN